MLNLRIDEIVKPKNFMKKVIVEASKNSTDDTNQSDRDYISDMVSISYMTHIKHDKPSWSKQTTPPWIANLYELS